MKKINIPIGFKLIAITSLILLISLLGTNYLAGRFFERDTVTRIQEVTADRSRLLSLKVHADITYMMSLANVLAKNLINGTFSQYRDEELESAGRLYYVGVYQKSESSPPKLLYDQVNFANTAQISNVEIFRGFRSLVNFLEEVPPAPAMHNITSVVGFPVLALVFPLDDDPTSFVLAYLNESLFTEAINTVSEYETYIIDQDGELLAHPNLELLRGGVSFASDEIVKALLSSPINNGQMTYLNRNGIEHIGSFFKLELASLGIVSTAEREEILQAVFQIRRRNYYITGIVLFVSILIVYIFAKTLSNPIRRLVAAVREIEKGNFLLDIESSTRDEIGDLTESFAEMGKGLDERDRMKDALGKFVNEEIANLALKGQLRLGGELKEAAVFFSDIRSFTAISEKLTPEEVVEFLNEYMTAMVACVERTKGIVDKFIGDAVMAVWGAPISYGNDTENAIDSALMMRKALAQFNEGRGSDKKPIIKIGCGINTGPLVSGQIGSEKRMEYTVIGDAVNLASRIEGLTKPFGVDILISENSFGLVNEVYDTEPMPPIMVKGKSDPIKIYAVIGRKDNSEDFHSIEGLRKYLGTEGTDLSRFDAEAKEEKFSAVK